MADTSEVFSAPLALPRAAPQNIIADRYQLVPQFRLEPTSQRSPDLVAAQNSTDISAILAAIADINAQLGALTASVAMIDARVTVLETMIDGASITAVCNMDGTITVTLTWG